jgi:hypothetical protein
MSADYLPEVIPVTPSLHTHQAEIMDKDTPVKQVTKPEEEDKLEEEEEDDITPTLQVKTIIEDEVIFKEPKPKPKRKATEKQKEHLARCREKALEKRKANAEVNRQAKEEKQKDKDAKKEIRLETIRQREAKREEKEALKTPSVSYSASLKQPSFSKDDILQIQEEAINNYETKRKAKKEAKKKALDQETHDKKVYDAVAKAVGPTNPDDVWNICFQ